MKTSNRSEGLKPKNKITEELTQLYRQECKGMDVLLRLTPLEVEHLNVLVDLGMRSRRSFLIQEARKQKRRLNDWEKHLLSLDRQLWQKIRDAEKLALPEEAEEHQDNTSMVVEK